MYRELEGVDLVGVYDKNPQRAATVRAEFDTPVLQDLEDLQGRADAVSVAVPTVETVVISQEELRHDQNQDQSPEHERHVKTCPGQVRAGLPAGRPPWSWSE